MNNYRYLLFDADNTLFDFDLAEHEAFRETAEAASLPYSEELYRTYSEINKAQWRRLEKKEITLSELKTERFRLLLEHLGMDSGEDEANRLCGLFLDHMAVQGCLIDGAEALCERLSKDYTLCLATNGIQKIQRSRFEHSPLKPYFSRIYISEEIGAAKPEPAYFEYIMKDLGDPPKEEVLMIGDSLSSDCDGAIGYGIDICRYNPKDRPDEGRVLTYTIRELTQLIEILEKG